LLGHHQETLSEAFLDVKGEINSMISVRRLTKRFGQFTAVNHLSFEVPKGQVLGFLGPNGAGKSTTMKMLTCFSEPTSGDILVDGFNTKTQSLEVRRLIGYLPESAPSYGEMRVIEFLQFVGETRGLRGKNLSERLQVVKETCALSDVWMQPIETLSKGYRQRVGFGQALIHDPPLLILDEPTDGLDPNQKHEVRRLIKKMAREKTIILSTHILEEVEAVCDRVIIIAQGSLVADETPDGLRRKSPSFNAVTVQFTSHTSPQIIERFKEIGRVERVENNPDLLKIYPIHGEAIAPKVSEISRRENLVIQELTVDHGKLDEVFRQVTTMAPLNQGEQSAQSNSHSQLH
jgi:ABC-2 type transport system ATP-binding protein